jgi:hypothetical protein
MSDFVTAPNYYDLSTTRTWFLVFWESFISKIATGTNGGWLNKFSLRFGLWWSMIKAYGLNTYTKGWLFFRGFAANPSRNAVE